MFQFLRKFKDWLTQNQSSDDYSHRVQIIRSDNQETHADGMSGCEYSEIYPYNRWPFREGN